LIEPFQKDAVLVHFDTEPNRRYELQFSTNAIASGAATWRTVFAIGALPFPNHYIIYHSMTNGRAGVFRLMANP
jgi:hypothetical protein